MLHRLAVGGCVLGSALAITTSASAAKLSPFRVHHSRAHANAVRSNAVRPATTSSSVVLYVNVNTGTDTSNTCRVSGHPCKTITHALSEAPVAATIDVAAGTYPEQLTITQNVTINGVLKNGARPIIKPTSTSQLDTDPDNSSSPTFPIVDFQPGVTNGNLDNVTVDGTGSTNSTTCGDDPIGVYYHDASGALTSDNVTGVDLPQGAFGCQGGLAIYAATDNGSATPSHVKMTTVTVNNYDKNGITCDDVGTLCTITSSTVTGDGPIPTNANPDENVAQNGIQFFDGAGSVTNSTVTGNSYTSPDYCPTTGACNGGTPSSSYTVATGIIVLDAGPVTLNGDNVNANDENVVNEYDPTDFSDANPGTGAGFSVTATNVSTGLNHTGTFGSSEAVPFGGGVGDGLDLYGLTSASNIHGNTAWNDVEYGIDVDSTTDATVFGNRTGKANVGSTHYQDGDGIFVTDNSSSNTVQSNTSDNNVFDGILADNTTSGNTFKSNTLSNNAQYDAQDQSTDGGTAGTANTWTGNHCTPPNDSNPSGLCS